MILNKSDDMNDIFYDVYDTPKSNQMQKYKWIPGRVRWNSVSIILSK